MAWDPQRPIEVTNPFSAGGDSDLSGRTAMDAAQKHLGQPIITVNRPGAGSAIGYNFINTAPPDGQSIVWTSGSLLTVANAGNLPFKYDKIRHIARMGVIPTVIAVKTDAPWKDLKEFMAFAKANPGKVKLGDSGTGSFTFVASKILEKANGVKFTNVPVGADRRAATILSGEVDASIVHPGEVISLHKGGDVRFLAISIDERHPQFPDLPTFKEQGFDIGVVNFRGVGAPPGTSDEIVKRYADAFEKASTDPVWLSMAEGRLVYKSSFLAGDEYQAFLAKQNAQIHEVLVSVGLAK